MALVMGTGALWRISVAAQAPAEMTLEIEDFVAMPVTGKLEGAQTPNESALSRVNAIREETGGSHRLFLPVVSGPITSTTRRPRRSRPISTSTATARTAGSSRSSSRLSGFGNGINGFNLDPDYANNGKFYTTHMEDPSIEAPGVPQNTMFPRSAGLRLHDDARRSRRLDR